MNLFFRDVLPRFYHYCVQLKLIMCIFIIRVCYTVDNPMCVCFCVDNPMCVFDCFFLIPFCQELYILCDLSSDEQSFVSSYCDFFSIPDDIMKLALAVWSVDHVSLAVESAKVCIIVLTSDERRLCKCCTYS